VVDRRLSRRRYDAARTVKAFAPRLHEQLDLDALSVELLAVIEQTMQSAQASPWLRPVAATAKPVAAHTSSQMMLACQPNTPGPGKAAIAYRCAASPTTCDQEHHGDRGHEDVGIEETLLRGDPSSQKSGL
jgi:hypothetical protein